MVDGIPGMRGTEHFPVGRGKDKNSRGGAGWGEGKNPRGGAKKRVNQLFQNLT